MWLATSDSFLSIVADRASRSNLLVRARVAGHIKKVFPEATVFTDRNADYFYRAYIPRKMVAEALADAVSGIGYDNFKNSVENPELLDRYHAVWEVMRTLQESRLHGSQSS